MSRIQPDIRQPAITPDLNDVQNRLKIHVPTILTRDLAAGVVAALFAGAMIRLTSADRFIYSLPAVALASVLGWNHFETKRAETALIKRAAQLFVAPGPVPEDVKDYIEFHPGVWEEVSRSKGQPEVAAKLKDYFIQALKEKRLDTAEFLLEKKFVKFIDVMENDLRGQSKTTVSKWLFSYLSLKDFDNHKKGAMVPELWRVIYEEKENVTDSPLFKELLEELLTMDLAKRLSIILQLIKNGHTIILEILRDRGFQFEEFFIASCPENVIEQIDKKTLLALSNYLKPDQAIAFKLWGKICSLNFINEDLYQLYSQSTPADRPDLVVWDLNKALEGGCSKVIEFFLENKKIKVTDQMAHYWWVNVRHQEMMWLLISYPINPNAKNGQGETPLMTINKGESPSYMRTLSRKDHHEYLQSQAALQIK